MNLNEMYNFTREMANLLEDEELNNEILNFKYFIENKISKKELKFSINRTKSILIMYNYDEGIKLIGKLIISCMESGYNKLALLKVKAYSRKLNQLEE